MKLGPCSIMLLAVLPACTTRSPASESLGESAQAIVRGQVENDRPYVVMIHEERIGGLLTYCSGTVIAPRVVLTAAHCIKSDRWDQGTFIYWGKDYAADLSLLIPNGAGPSTAPPPSPKAVWALAQAVTVYPTYDATLNHPDIAVLYLDRDAPMDPLPLHRKRIRG